MAVKLRLRRLGRKKKPFYRIIAADSRAPRDGRFIEEIGYYNPIADPMTIEVQEDRVLYWLSKGAIPTTTVKSLLRKKGITLRFDLMKQGLPEEKISEEMKKWEVMQLERHKRLEVKKAAGKKKAKEEKKKEPAVEQETVAVVEQAAPETPKQTEAAGQAEPEALEEAAAEEKTSAEETSSEEDKK